MLILFIERIVLFFLVWYESVRFLIFFLLGMLVVIWYLVIDILFKLNVLIYKSVLFILIKL